MNEDLAPYRPRIERLKARAEHKAKQAARKGDAKAVAGYTRAAAHLADALTRIPEAPKSEEEQMQEIRAELHRRLALFAAYEEEDFDLEPSPPAKGERAG